MSAQNPRIRLIGAVQAIRHSPITVTLHPQILPSRWMELCEAYDDLLLTMAEVTTGGN